MDKIDPNEPIGISQLQAAELAAKGITNLESIGIQVVDQKEIDDNAAKGELICVCMPCKFGPSAVPNASVGRCGKCGCDVWISPATKQTMPIEAFIRCLVCISDDLKEVKE